MKEIKRKWDILSKGERKASIEKIITFFHQERDEQIGIIAAEELLDFFLQTNSGTIYNKGVEASKDLLKKRFDDFEFDLDLLLNK